MRKKVGIVCIVLGALMVLAAAGLALYNGYSNDPLVKIVQMKNGAVALN